MAITSLSGLGAMWNKSHKDNRAKIKPKKTVAKVKKCPKCGNELRNVPNTNVWLCDFVDLKDEVLNGKEVQVFSKCNFQVFD